MTLIAKRGGGFKLGSLNHEESFLVKRYVVVTRLVRCNKFVFFILEEKRFVYNTGFFRKLAVYFSMGIHSLFMETKSYGFKILCTSSHIFFIVLQHKRLGLLAHGHSSRVYSKLQHKFVLYLFFTILLIKKALEESFK